MEPNPQKMTSPNPSLKGGEGEKNLKKWRLVNLSMEMGFIIALPLVVFALGGKWLDGRLNLETQWFTLLGVIVAITLTTVWLTRRIKELIK